MLRTELKEKTPEILERLFLTKQEALDSGITGTVYVGYLAVHSVYDIKIREIKGTDEVQKVINFIWHRTFWE